MGFTLTALALADALVRRFFTSSGLHPETLHLDSDTTLRYWISTPTSPPKPPLLLIHGFGTDATWQWSLQVRPLSRHFSLIVPDLIFFGGSTTTSPHRSEAFQASCIVQLLNSLTIVPPLSVVGTSYGGFVAYHVAKMMREKVGRVVIASSDLLKGEEDDVALRERAGIESVADLMLPTTTANMRTLLKLSMYKQPRFLPDFLLREIMKKISEGMKEKMELMKGLTIGKKEQFQLSPLPQAEVLIIWGEHDNIFPLEKAHMIKKQLGEKARLEILENTSHVPQSEAPSHFNKVLLSFLLGVPKSSM